MTPVLAHGSGWDEILLFLAIPTLWATFAAIRRAADRRRACRTDPTDRTAGSPPPPP